MLEVTDFWTEFKKTLSIESIWKCAPKVNSTQDKKIWCIGRKNCCRTYACNLAKPAPISSLSWAQSRKGHGVVHIWFLHRLWLKIKQVVFSCPKNVRKKFFEKWSEMARKLVKPLFFDTLTPSPRKFLPEMVWNSEQTGQIIFFSTMGVQGLNSRTFVEQFVLVFL